MSPSEQDSESSVSWIAFQETLDLLEWPRLCEHLSKFAATAQGRRACKRISFPEDLADTRRILSETLEIGSLDELLEGGLNFQGVNDCSDILSRCNKGGIASGEELLLIAETLGAARRIRRQVDDAELRPMLTNLLTNLATLPDLEKLLKSGLEEGGRVADRSSHKLSLLRNSCKRLRSERFAILQNIQVKYASFLQDTVIADRNNRPVLAFKVGTSDQLSGVVHDSSASGNTIFLEPQIVIPLGNRIADLQAQIFEEEQRLLKQWSSEVGENFFSLDHLLQVMLHLDLALARARYGKWLGGVPPLFEEDVNASFVFREFRHPLLIWQEYCNQGDVVVPITLEVASDLRVVAITGPNTGGKTVTLKSVGLGVLMARAGLLLPCDESPSLPWVKQVLADIGDEQSLQQNLSTFSGHVIRIRRILKAIQECNGSAIVLLDEVGAGTDPIEGTALAIALLKTLAERARLTIATTHFGELKSLKYSDSRFENASVAFDSETLAPTYCLRWGIPGRSNALAIANRLGLDPPIIERAQELISENSSQDVNQVIRGLEEQRARQQLAAEEAAALLARTELLHDELLSRWERQRQQSKNLQERGRQELETSIRQGQKEVRQLISRLRQEGADGETARIAGQRLRRMEIENGPQLRCRDNKGWSPKVGERIRLLALNKSAEVVEISEDGLYLTVLCGILRSTIHLSGVQSLDGENPRQFVPDVDVKISSTSASSSPLRTKRNTVDVRGLRVHEAEIALEEYLRKAAGPVWVVHGIGTGKLKHGLRKWLESLSYVERVSDADINDGGQGCSVIWLRY